MIPVLTPQSMREADRAGVEELGYTGMQLMENAARSATSIIAQMLPTGSSILVLCGTGNNGGDGFAIARMLKNTRNNYAIRVVWIGSHERMTAETAQMFTQCCEAGVDVLHAQSEQDIQSLVGGGDVNNIVSSNAPDHSIVKHDTPTHEYECIIDALCGIGGSSELRGLVVPLLRLVNALAALRIAIDIPSGLDAATGDAHESCFVADHTITMAAVKSGLFLKGAKDVCGNVRVAPIGLSDSIVQSRAFAHIVEHHDVMAMYSPRKSDTSKFDYGRVCVIAGSRDMPGAAALCANAAILCGAGMVELCSTAFHPHLLPEVLQTHLPSTDIGTIAGESTERLRVACSKADCIVIGPGIENHEQTLSVIAALIAEFGNHKTVIVDADGLRAVPCSGPVGVNVVLTPHQGELARLFQRCEAAGASVKSASVKSASVKSVSELASYLGCIVVAKGVPVRISNGSHELWNVNGNAGMATAGSGDVAAGVIAAMVCRLSTQPLLSRVAAGVYIHALAGDMAAEQYTQEGVTASRIGSLLHEALRAITAQPERAR